MDIRLIEKSEYLEAKQLWQLSFGDSSGFIDYYFAKKVKSENILGAFEGSRLVSMLVMLDRVFVLNGNKFKSSFIAGCCTLPDSRGKGYMRTLLGKSEDIMFGRGCVFCFLHPFDHSFYRKLGWESVSDMESVSAAPVSDIDRSFEPDAYSIDALHNIYDSYTGSLNGFFLRDIDDMRIRIHEHINDGGHVLFDGVGGYYAMYFAEKDKVEVIENTCASNAQYLLMIRALSRYGVNITYYRPCECGRNEYTMMKVLDKKSAQDLLDGDCDADDLNADVCGAVRRRAPVIFEQY